MNAQPHRKSKHANGRRQKPLTAKQRRYRANKKAKLVQAMKSMTIDQQALSAIDEG